MDKIVSGIVWFIKWVTKNFRPLWWIVLIICFSTLLFRRPSIFPSEKKEPADILLFLVWLGVCLGPLYSEIRLPGLTLKRKIEEAKRQLSGDIESLRNEIRTSVEVRSHFAPSVYVNAPASDRELREAEQRLHAAVERLEQQGHPIEAVQGEAQTNRLSEQEEILFRTRRDMEVELRGIANTVEDEPDQRHFATTSRLIYLLKRQGIIDAQLANVIREIYSICSFAVHGEPVTDAQVVFVTKSGPELINALKAIRQQRG